MAQITGIPTLNDGDLCESEYIDEIKTEHNETDTRLVVAEAAIVTVDGRVTALEGSGNVVRVNTLADFPAPVANVITLASNTIYVVSGTVSIGANEFVFSEGSFLRGNYAATDQIISTTTNAIITATNVSFRIEQLRIIASSSTGFDLNGTTTENAVFANFTLIANSLGTVADYSAFDLDKGNLISTTTGLAFSGAMFAIVLKGAAISNQSGTGLDLNGCTASIIQINKMYFINANSTPAITVSASGANLNANSIGTIIECSFSDPVNAITGYSPLDEKWSVTLNQNDSILPSDRLEPAGYGDYHDDVSGNISVTTAWTKITVNGLGGSTFTDQLPKSIRATGDLWDIATSNITPVALNDAYDFRLLLNILSTAGGAGRLFFALDIGTSEVSPTNIVLNNSQALSNTANQPIVFGDPFYSRATFLANNGRFFVKTDSGTCVISTRSTMIQRLTSGAS